jgi:hypothetical protein
MTKEYRVYSLALFAGVCAAAISYFAPFFPYGVDSASYIEQARSLMTRGVFEITPYGTDEIRASIPETLFPAGYPIIIAIGSLLLQLPSEVIAPILSLAALVLLPTVIIFCFQHIIGLKNALWIGILVVLTPAAVRHGYIAFSDTLSLSAIIFSIYLLLKAENKPSSWLFLGLLTGFAYLIRNANLSLIISMSLFLAWMWLIEPENRTAIVKNTLVWIFGNSLVIVPWLIRNFLVFGSFQPYSMSPSTVGLNENIHDYIQSQLDTLLSLSELDKWIASNISGLLLLVIILGILIYQTVITWKQWQKIEQKTFVISSFFVVIYSAMVIVARTKYQWGEHIVGRYTLPSITFIFIDLVIILKYSTLKINKHYLAIAITLSLLLARAVELPKFYAYDSYHQSILYAAQQVSTHEDSVCSHLNGRFAVSNQAFVYRILCATPVRHGSLQYDKFEESLKNMAALGEKQGIVISQFGWKDDKKPYLPLKQDDLNKLNSLGWQVERNESEYLIISHKATSL